MTATLYSTDELLALLPQLYRIRDAENDGALRELFDVLVGQVNVLAESIEQLYDDQFIETAADWVTPYIGDLIGYRPLYGVVPSVSSPRAEVANTIRFRRRKGTASMLEQLARDVTGWPARSVEFFEQLATTQYMNHVRTHAAATASMRGAAGLELRRTNNRAFDALAHTAEMRHIDTAGGRYNIPNIGIFLWRLDPSHLGRSPLVGIDGSGTRYQIDPLGIDRQIYARPRTEEEITHIAEPFDVPLGLGVRWTSEHLGAYHGAGLSFHIEELDGPISTAVTDVRICDLSDDPNVPGTWAHSPGAGDTHTALDPLLGRVAFVDPPSGDDLRVISFCHANAVNAGGGGYDRSESLDAIENLTEVALGQSLVASLNGVADGGGVEIVDNFRYNAPATITATVPPLNANDREVTLRAANRQRPLLSRGGQMRLMMEGDTTVVLDGLVLEGAPIVIDEVADADIRHLVLRHCTLVPGWRRTDANLPVVADAASLIALHPFASITIEHCMLGPIVAVEDTTVAVSNSIIDASSPQGVAFCGRDPSAPGVLREVTNAAARRVGDGLDPGGHLTLDACTVIGKVHATRLDVSNSIHLASLGPADLWPAPVWARRRQEGCMRFSYVPDESRTPRRHMCVPRQGVDAVPQHTSIHFGDSAYGQLGRSTDVAIRQGADDESEMGVTHELYQPQRETNLRLRLDEYLRFGLEAGFFYAT